jgi:hypothetical protein
MTNDQVRKSLTVRLLYSLTHPLIWMKHTLNLCMCGRDQKNLLVKEDEFLEVVIMCQNNADTYFL